MRRYILILALLMASTSPVAAQTIDFTYTFGKVFDIPQETFTPYLIPGIELKKATEKGGDVEFQFRILWDAYDLLLSRQDIKFGYNRQMVEWSPRLNLAFNITHLTYFVDFRNPRNQRSNDWVVSLDGRFRLKK